MADVDQIDFDALIAPFAVPASAPLAVAVSGGPDSMALLVLAADEAKRSGRTLLAVTVDHGLRQAAQAEAEQVATWAADLGVRHTTLTHTGPVPRSDIQATARDIRYGLIRDWANGVSGLAGILVAHSMDDQAETLLLRMGRGSGVDGLAAMRADTMQDGLRLLRPLLRVRRESLLSLLHARGQAFLEDPSNHDRQHARVRMRTLMPDLAAEGLTVERLADTADRMSRARDALAGWTRSHLAACVQFHDGGWGQFERAPFVDVPDEIGLRAIVQVIQAVGAITYPPRLVKTQALLERLKSPDFSGATLAGVRFLSRRGLVYVARELDAVSEPTRVPAGADAVAIWDNRFAISHARGSERPGTVVGALGADRFRDLQRIQGLDAGDAPKEVFATLPAVFDRGEVLEVPAFGYCADDAAPHYRTAFIGPARAGLEKVPVLSSAG